jgi:hypothetical protein
MRSHSDRVDARPEAGLVLTPWICCVLRQASDMPDRKNHDYSFNVTSASAAQGIGLCSALWPNLPLLDRRQRYAAVPYSRRLWGDHDERCQT